MADPIKQDQFRKYLDSNLSRENLDFYVHIDAFKALEGDEAAHRAVEIWRRFVGGARGCLVNLDEGMVMEIEGKVELKEIDRGMFDMAQRFVGELMKGCLPAYLRSVFFLRVCFRYACVRHVPEEVFLRGYKVCEGTWSMILKKKGVLVYYKRVTEGKSDRHYIKGVVEIDRAHTNELVKELKSTQQSRKLWDKQFKFGEVIETIDAENQLNFMTYKHLKEEQRHTIFVTHKTIQNATVLMNLNVYHEAVGECQQKEESCYICAPSPENENLHVLSCFIHFEHKGAAPASLIQEFVKKLYPKHLQKLKKALKNPHHGKADKNHLEHHHIEVPLEHRFEISNLYQDSGESSEIADLRPRHIQSFGSLEKEDNRKKEYLRKISDNHTAEKRQRALNSKAERGKLSKTKSNKHLKSKPTKIAKTPKRWRSRAQDEEKQDSHE
uniref:RGS domain-containing protein n=1 Tax=Arcella intermedia TaxID=1963864 RepID=A0A6B2L499_9EUKA